MNGKSGPATTPLIVRLGDRVRLRFINLGMDHHPIHMHGHQFVITGTEGGRQPQSTWGPNNTVLVGVAQARARRVRRHQSRRLDDSLPHATPHDEPDVFDGRPDHAPRGNARRRRHGRRHGHRARRQRHLGRIRPESRPRHGRQLESSATHNQRPAHATTRRRTQRPPMQMPNTQSNHATARRR